MLRRLAREGLLFALLLAGMALLMHPDLLSRPGERFTQLFQRGALLHPLIYAALSYLLLLFARLLRLLLTRLWQARRTPR